jgi:hypothetical protein
MKYSIIIANPKGEYLRRYALPDEGEPGDGWHRPHFIAAHIATSRPVLLTKHGLKISKRIERENIPDRVHLDSTSFQVSKYRPREAMPWDDGTQPRVISADYADALDEIDLEIKQLQNQSRILREAAWNRARPLTLADISQGNPNQEARDETPTAP